MKKSVVLIFVMLVGVAVFELSPAIERARIVVPEEIYVGEDCGCDCISKSRPWYSTFNYWFWLWVIGTPAIVFSVTPITSRSLRTTRTVVAIGFCYGVMNLALHLMWDIENGPFVVNSTYSWQKTWDIPNCANIADGASVVFTLMFGWVYASIYTGWWEMAWYQYHKRKTKLIDENFKRDIVNKVVVAISYLVARLAILIIIAFPFAIASLYVLEKLELLKGYESLF